MSNVADASQKINTNKMDIYTNKQGKTVLLSEDEFQILDGQTEAHVCVHLNSGCPQASNPNTFSKYCLRGNMECLEETQ